MTSKVLYCGREAVFTRYFDFECLKFKKVDGKPNFDDKYICEYDDLPDEYVVYFWSIPMENRKNIKFVDADEAGDKRCICRLLGRCDAPKDAVQNGFVELIGEDPLEYEKGDFASSNKYANVRCLSCGCEYKINIVLGYRTSYYNWEKM